jgi:hypothetical protein
MDPVGGAIGASWAFALVEALILPAWVLTLRRSLRSINVRKESQRLHRLRARNSTWWKKIDDAPARVSLVWRGGPSRPHYYSKLLTLTSSSSRQQTQRQGDLLQRRTDPRESGSPSAKRFGEVVQIADRRRAAGQLPGRASMVKRGVA